MYSHCLFCHAFLGRNAAIVAMPVGRRLAFDETRGRLWIVCSGCARWNLTALEERWEAIEECEREFRGTRLRFSTENISLARLRDGTELVRIGKALLPEIASWRYGTALQRRRLPRAGGWLERDWPDARDSAREAIDRLVRSIPGVDLPYDAVTWLRIHRRGSRVLTLIEREGRPPAPLRFVHLEAAELLRPARGQHWLLRVRHDAGVSVLSGDAALRVGAKLLAAVNGRGATLRHVLGALARLDDAGRPESYFARVGALALRTSWGRFPDAPRDLPLEPERLSVAERLALRLTNRSFWGRGGTGSEHRTALPRLPLVDRLALEMAANEDAERRALEGELRHLEAAWREAEEIAAIADGLSNAWAEGFPFSRRRAIPVPASPDLA